MEKKLKLALPLIFILLVAAGAVMILFPGPLVTEVGDTYEPGTTDATGDEAGLGFEFWAVDSAGNDVQISDMASFNALAGDVYLGNTKISNLYANVYVTYATSGFVYGDSNNPLNIETHVAIHDWTAYTLVTGGGSRDRFDLPYSLFSFSLPRELDPGGPSLDVEREPWCAISKISISPNAPTSSDDVQIIASIESGWTYGGYETLSFSEENNFKPLSTTGLSATVTLTVGGTSYGTHNMQVDADFATYTLVSPPGQSTVNAKVDLDFNGAKASASYSFFVGGAVNPDEKYYWAGEYASDADRLGYTQLSYETTWTTPVTAASSTDLLVGSVYFVDPGDGSPYLVPTGIATGLQGWFDFAWESVWQYGEPQPEDAMLRTYLKAYSNFMGSEAGTLNPTTIQSEWSSTVGITVSNTAGTTAGAILSASSFGGVSGGLDFLPVTLMLVGGFGFFMFVAIPNIRRR